MKRRKREGAMLSRFYFLLHMIGHINHDNALLK